MNKKKQGSLSSKVLKPKSLNKIYQVDKNNEEYHKNNRLPSACLTLLKINQFIQQYQILKQQFNFNIMSHQFFEQVKTQTYNNDEQFVFDIDLGVPYAQSQHLDSGIQYQQQNQFENKNIPIITSGKQIFTSILDFEKSQNDLEQENFTDQEDQDEQFSVDNSKKTTFGSRSRKQMKIPFEIDQNKTMLQFQKEDIQQKQYQQHAIVQQAYNKQESRSIVKKIKLKSQFRQQKLNYWNNTLSELEKSADLNKNLLESDIPLNQQKKSAKIVLFKNQISQNLKHVTSKIKKTKFQKCPSQINKFQRIQQKQNQIDNIRNQQSPKVRNKQKIMIKIPYFSKPDSAESFKQINKIGQLNQEESYKQKQHKNPKRQNYIKNIVQKKQIHQNLKRRPNKIY